MLCKQSGVAFLPLQNVSTLRLSVAADAGMSKTLLPVTLPSRFLASVLSRLLTWSAERQTTPINWLMHHTPRKAGGPARWSVRARRAIIVSRAPDCRPGDSSGRRGATSAAYHQSSSLAAGLRRSRQPRDGRRRPPSRPRRRRRRRRRRRKGRRPRGAN